MKKNISKVVALLIAIIAVLSVTGCGMQPATVPSENRVKISEFGDKATGVEAICKTLLEKEFVPKDECIKTSAELIGAKKGYRMEGITVHSSKFSINNSKIFLFYFCANKKFAEIYKVERKNRI